jgi:hypothetical protein
MQHLEAWMDTMLKKKGELDGSIVMDESTIVTERDVLLVALHEVARQVSVNCDERGRLLFRIRQYVACPAGTLISAPLCCMGSHGNPVLAPQHVLLFGVRVGSAYHQAASE